MGQILNQISLYPYQTQFVFGQTTILSELSVEQIEPDGAIWQYDCVSWEGGPILLHRLVNRTVVGIIREDLRLTIVFDNGAKLTILSDLSGYEAGQIANPENFIVF